MSRHFDSVDWREFANIIKAFPFSRQIREVHLHHTWRPRQKDYRGLATIQAMWRVHTQENHWDDIAQHVSIGPDGLIWICRNFNWAPASAKGFNGNAHAGPFMIEMIGDFDVGRETITEKQEKATLAVIKAVQERFDLKPGALRFHNEMSQKSCPGSSTDKQKWISNIKAFKASARTGAARSGPFDDQATRAWQIVRSLNASSPQTDLDRVMAADHPHGHENLNGDARGGTAARGGNLTNDMIDALSGHIVNLEMGQYSDDGLVSTDKGDVDHLFDNLLPDFIARQKGRGPARILFYAHGGLVNEKNALLGAYKQHKFWLDNGVYPVFFIWEVGMGETIWQLLTASRSRGQGARGARSFADLPDMLIEELSRPAGKTIWSGMKRSAELASADDGGAHYVARRAAQLFCDHKNAVEYHAIGHSAGAIFQTHFLPCLTGYGGKVKSAHFMAPAVRTDLFKDKLKPLIGKTKDIESLTVFTMRKALERDDNVAVIYRKSLLYLVQNALETHRDDPILGLEISLRADKKLRRFFGLDGTTAQNDVIWSQTDAAATGDGSLATSHGGFDDDPATMESIFRRMAGRRDGSAITPFPTPRAGAQGDVWTDQAELSEDLQDYLAALSVPEVAQADSVSEPASAPAPETAWEPAPLLSLPSNGVIKRRIALCIGIDHYQKITPLRGCINDAKAWAAHLTRLGYDVRKELDADAETIRERVESMIGDARAGDSLVLQFSGHGTQFKDIDGDEADGDTPGLDECICAVDCDSSDNDGLVIDDEFRTLFARLPDGAHLTCFFDCCHSGTMSRAFARTVHVEAAGDRRPRFVEPTERMRSAYRVRLAKSRSKRANLMSGLHDVQYSACRSYELAYEQDGQGDFTRHACRVLERNDLAMMTNSGFRDLVVSAFGTGPRQNPDIHCDDGRLLQESFLQLRH